MIILLSSWRSRMKRSWSYLFLVATSLLPPAALHGQGGYRGGGLSQAGRHGAPAPKLPGVELVGPLDTALARVTLHPSADQTNHYQQAHDSLMGATPAQRDSAQA